MLEQHYPLWKTTNLVINPGNIPSCLARFIRKTNFSREWIRRLFLPHRKVSPFYFSPTWTFPFVYRAGFRSLLTFLPPLRPCLPAFPSPSLGGAIRVGRAGHLLYARRKGGRRYKGGAKQEGISSSSSSVKTSRGVANGLVLETSRAGFRIPLPR